MFVPLQSCVRGAVCSSDTFKSMRYVCNNDDTLPPDPGIDSDNALVLYTSRTTGSQSHVYCNYFSVSSKASSWVGVCLFQFEFELSFVFTAFTLPSLSLFPRPFPLSLHSERDTASLPGCYTVHS